MLIMDKDYSKEIPHWLFKQLPYNHYSVNVDGKSMHVMEKGTGRPIVFVPVSYTHLTLPTICSV